MKVMRTAWYSGDFFFLATKRAIVHNCVTIMLRQFVKLISKTHTLSPGLDILQVLRSSHVYLVVAMPHLEVIRCLSVQRNALP